MKTALPSPSIRKPRNLKRYFLKRFFTVKAYLVKLPFFNFSSSSLARKSSPTSNTPSPPILTNPHPLSISSPSSIFSFPSLPITPRSHSEMQIFEIDGDELQNYTRLLDSFDAFILKHVSSFIQPTGPTASSPSLKRIETPFLSQIRLKPLKLPK
ncbi:hypothetical protein HMI54_001106 [Coelomomyces lativittatus]|nr:hypothetical protein HMI56_002790 [Coelomomyces lativittatus]KAJ1510501.1 hypothetical protein HMI55_006969 [Coelomomyces lativittatus]KAJ1511026.1 hypothetical protein HMI54_001106 [Coelomomyces lativittatus]